MRRRAVAIHMAGPPQSADMTEPPADGAGHSPIAPAEGT